MKKLFAITLALVMMFTMATVAFAATNTGGSTDINVSGQYADNSQQVESISVDISWGAMKFVYTTTGNHVWNPGTHDYDDNTQTDWVPTGNTVTIFNHSSVDVDVALSFTANQGFETVRGSFKNGSFSLPSAVGKTTTDENLMKVATLDLSGTLNESNTTLATIGKIVVSISQKQTTNP